MTTVTTLECPACSAPLELGAERCAHCGAAIYIARDLRPVNLTNVQQEQNRQYIRRYRAATRQDPDDELAHYGLGVAYYNAGFPDAAIKSLTRAVDLMPDNVGIRLQLARVEYVSGSRDAAWRHANICLKAVPGLRDAQAFTILRDLLSSVARDDPKALEQWDQLAKLDIDLANSVAAQLSQLRLQVADACARRYTVRDHFRREKSDRDRAMRLWEQVLAVDPDRLREPLACFLTDHRHILLDSDAFAQHPARLLEEVNAGLAHLPQVERRHDAHKGQVPSTFVVGIGFVVFVLFSGVYAPRLVEQVFVVARAFGVIVAWLTPTSGGERLVEWWAENLAGGGTSAFWSCLPLAPLALLVVAIARAPSAPQRGNIDRRAGLQQRIDEIQHATKKTTAEDEFTSYLSGKRDDPGDLVKAARFVLHRAGAHQPRHSPALRA